jgi:hypothetical protein
MYTDNGIIEAIMPEVTVSPIDTYDRVSAKDREIIEITVTDRTYKLIQAKARSIVGTEIKYGIRDCIAGGICTRIGRRLVD